MKVKLCVPILLTIIATGAFAMISTLSLDDLVIQSDLIVKVTVAATSEVTIDGASGVTLETLADVGEVLKGSEESKRIKIFTTKGAEDQPNFKDGQRALLFLQNSPLADGYVVTNLIQGWWPMDESDAFLAMGTGTAMSELTEAIARNKDKVPQPVVIPEPEF